MPEFDLLTTDGCRLRKADFVGKQPLLLSLSSISCPMTMSSISELKGLYATYGDRVTFASVYVREAHPGENFPQPKCFEQKLAHARAFRDSTKVPWTVAVDDIDGTLDRSLGSSPNLCYVMDTEGRVASRSLYSNDEPAIRRMLENAVSAANERVENSRSLVPLLKGLGVINCVLRSAGKQAVRDFRRQLPPLYLAASLAIRLKPLTPLQRGVTALAICTLSPVAMVATLYRLVNKNIIEQKPCLVSPWPANLDGHSDGRSK